ncbi:hypothetical protein C8Q80DRAFT_1126031, partial [Daedaleopsis nitida]
MVSSPVVREHASVLSSASECVSGWYLPRETCFRTTTDPGAGTVTPWYRASQQSSGAVPGGVDQSGL